MGKLIDSLTLGVKQFIGFLFNHFYTLFKDLQKAKKDIQLRYLMSDFISVLRSAGMFTFFNLVALVVFTVLPQGRDILLIIAEDISRPDPKFGNLFFLLAGVVFWSIVSEYGTRYSIYVTDNSGNSLSDKRVAWRKALQKTTAALFLMLPFLIVLFGFAINYVQDTSLSEKEKKFGFGIPALLLYLVFSSIARLYFKEREGKSKYFMSKYITLPPKEFEWCNKLLGIYNRYVFILRKPSNFSDSINGDYKSFCKIITDSTIVERNKFPQDAVVMDVKSRVPKEFRFEEFTSDGEIEEHDNDNVGGNYKWVYSIPISFYKTLHSQLKGIIVISITLFSIICIIPIRYYGNIGAPGLVVIAFGCWSGIYAGLLYVDYALLRSYKISLRFFLFIVLILTSFLNNDHPVRYNENGTASADKRPELKDHFLKWFAHYQKDTLNSLYLLRSDTTKTPFFPVVFVCAEGGALRTGAFTAQTLSFLQDSIYSHYGIDVRKSVYAFSGVSGGGLGISFFNAMAYLQKEEDLKQDTSYSSLAKLFFNEDYLAPVIGKMFYADIVNLFIPFHVEAFDRAIILEKSWEQGYEKILKQDGRNIFSSDVRNLYNDTSVVYPAIFINTTEAETGRQCWLSNVKPIEKDIILADKRDLLSYKIRGGINYSTMTNFGSRFPLFSPGATVVQDDGKKFHYVDGGYVENTGSGSMLEVLQALAPVFDTLRKGPQSIIIKPFVLILQYNQYNSGPPERIDFGNEFSEVVYGIYNTRYGRSTTALQLLSRYIRTLGGESLVLPLEKTGSEVPMNWVLSNKSLNKIESDIKAKWEQRDKGTLRKFFAIDTNTIKWKNLSKP